MTRFLIALLIAAAPVFAHEQEQKAASHHAHKGAPKDAPRSFDKQPAAGTWAKCAVSDEIFEVGAGTEFATYNGRVYAFCCPDCKPDFEKDPAKYAAKK